MKISFYFPAVRLAAAALLAAGFVAGASGVPPVAGAATESAQDQKPAKAAGIPAEKAKKPDAAQQTEAAQEPEATDYIRFIEDEEQASLQTAIASFVSPSGVVVDLVGAVHIADKKYFEALNARFKTYDSVLYELVGRPISERKELKAGDGVERLEWLGQLQETMRSTLALESQLKIIDYRAKNFVHADMTTEGFFETQEKKKETFFSLWMRAVAAQGLAGGNRPQPGVVKLLEILVRKDRDSATELKRLIGREFDTIEDLIGGIETDGGTVIIGERNRHALEVMEKQIQAGQKRLAIFYGAAHLPDMEERLLKMGFKRDQVEWLKAWDLPAEE